MPELETIKGFILDHAPRWFGALIIILIGMLASKLSKRWLTAILNRSRVRGDLLLKTFFLRSVSLAIVVATSLIALEQINVPVTSLVAGLGVTGLILGFGLRDTLSNFAAGLLLLIYRPFRAGELIEVEGSQGVVDELTIVNMQMTTTDGVRVIMPNSKVWGSKIVNYSLATRRRVELTLKVREDDLQVAIDAIKGALEGDSRVLDTPAPTIKVSSITDGNAMLTIWAWTAPEDFQGVSADAYIRLLIRLQQSDLQVV
jgi:small conductance mechanosensitive channel